MKYYEPREFSDKKPEPIVEPKQPGPTIRVRRTASHGDVIAATCVAKKLQELGSPVIFETNRECAATLGYSPHVNLISISREDGAVDLDGAYETHPLRRYDHFHSIFLASAARQLQGTVEIKDFHNAAPELTVSMVGLAKVAPLLAPFPKPWVMVCPRSNSFANKSVPFEVWSRMAVGFPATMFWTGTDPSPCGFVDLKCNNVKTLMAVLAHADVVVSVDTGPLHMAAALKRPLLAIGQASDPALHLSDQRDYSVLYPDGLDCLNCQELECPKAEVPPCRDINPIVLASAIRYKLDSISITPKVSAVICVYKPDGDRLARCLNAVYDQVDEVVIALDGDAELDIAVPNVKVVASTGHRLGYGRTANRGARHTSGNWLLMLNDDAYLKPDAVKNMMAVADTTTAVVGAQLWHPDGTIQHGGTIRYPGDCGWGHRDHRKTRPSITEPMETEFVCLAVGLVRRSAFYQVDGYDDSFDAYGEDGDLCLKLRRAGWKVMYQPHAKAIHEDGATTNLIGKDELGKAGRRIFRDKWAHYFKMNADNELGVF